MDPVFADVDTGIDDAIALIYLLASRDVELVGVGSSAGNVGVDQVCANNLGLLDLCGAADVPVSRGADGPLSTELPDRGTPHGPSGLGYAKLPPSTRRVTDYDSAAAWVSAARAYRGELIGLATAPLTNLALALRAEPELPTLLRRLVIMGGNFGDVPAPEWNLRVDPTATAEVFAAFAGRARLPVVCGLNLTRQMVMTPEFLARLLGAARSGPLRQFIYDSLRFDFAVHRDRGDGYLAYLHDPLAAGVALDPALVSTRPATVDVESGRGVAVADWSGCRKPNARIATDVDPAVFFERLVDRLASLAHRLG
ncbi:nucleoside hydrolase [Mycobacterium vicinigordonae]|uniref:Nucleoside hydrolase n=1 Tax=Mycobacterium vicinigordonae TaxID=1719132 RepID=A0A7D6I6Y2_9MYCO|nr:nucleoside hydrolase [Mycobacterium vicinigordonae]QLL08438.1 nucleoside hydrolase [Mycobacterium vicinigordonae]